MHSFLETFFTHYSFSPSRRQEFLKAFSRPYQVKIALLDRHLSSGNTLLDISTGEGIFLSYLFSSFDSLQFFTLDLVLSGSALSSFRSLNFSYSHRIFFNSGNVFSLPFKSSSFNILLSHNATHDLLMDSFSPEHFFAECARVLRTDGLIILFDKVLDNTDSLSADLNMELLQHKLFSLTGRRVFGLKHSSELRSFLTRFSTPVFEQLLPSSSIPDFMLFFEYFYDYDHWSPLFAHSPPDIQAQCKSLVEDFVTSIRSRRFTPSFCTTYLYIGRKISSEK